MFLYLLPSNPGPRSGSIPTPLVTLSSMSSTYLIRTRVFFIHSVTCPWMGRTVINYTSKQSPPPTEPKNMSIGDAHGRQPNTPAPSPASVFVSQAHLRQLNNSTGSPICTAVSFSVEHTTTINITAYTTILNYGIPMGEEHRNLYKSTTIPTHIFTERRGTSS